MVELFNMRLLRYARNDEDSPCESQAERNDTPCDGERSWYYFSLVICNEIRVEGDSPSWGRRGETPKKQDFQKQNAVLRPYADRRFLQALLAQKDSQKQPQVASSTPTGVPCKLCLQTFGLRSRGLLRLLRRLAMTGRERNDVRR